MATFNTQAIVLAKLPLFEADRLYILYAKNYGKLEAQVKSAVLSSSKLAGSLEPISLVETLIVRGKTREIIAGVQLIKRYQFDNLAVFQPLGLIRELFLKLVPLEAPEPALFENLSFYLSALEQHQDLPFVRFLTQRFIWQMLKILGYGLNFYDQFPPWPAKLSPKTQTLLKACLENNQFKVPVSDNLLTELEKFTQEHLFKFLERDLFSYNFKIYF